MKCQECVQACKEEGGMCAPLTSEERSWYEPWMFRMDSEHKRTAHAMALTGGIYHCDRGHRVEAHPADAMRAAGMEPML